MTKNNTPDKALVDALRAEGCRNGGDGAYAWRARELCSKAADVIERLSQPQHGGLVEALIECRNQLWLLAKDPENNPWIKQADAALASSNSPLIAVPDGMVRTYTEEQRQRAIDELSALRNRGHDLADDAVNTVAEALGLRIAAATGEA